MTKDSNFQNSSFVINLETIETKKTIVLEELDESGSILEAGLRATKELEVSTQEREGIEINLKEPQKIEVLLNETREIELVQGSLSATVEIDIVATGPPGNKGSTGETGPQGLKGETGLSAYEQWLSLGNQGSETIFIESLRAGKGGTSVHAIAAPSQCWEIEHNLIKYPSVTTVDTAGSTMFGFIEYVDMNRLRITFSEEVIGFAYLN